ncbi:uncharacterized protein BT62DRAFT_1071132 [Guyanagaster necrorhizus]|uniref:Uncharacterized protein n=1 Tax=Guyanagaster necrorhizus TaxID=856835 RepID=A0A9P8AZG0_9AGAR|nr:uncharacterized protein BT62DRAFT_1071132 [Guyanagaster necrorhizus MCA 3950]KAG7451927.1 hypothetical protein BT62DRAFT_1071132 [Guyanagaster necrorhizus MCA 3950]
MDSDDELPHWSVLIGRKSGDGSGKTKVKPGKRKASSSLTPTLRTTKSSKSLKKRRKITITEIIEISTDDEQDNYPKASRSRDRNTKSLFSVAGPATRSQGSNKTSANGTCAHVSTPTACLSKTYFEQLCKQTGQERDFIPRIPKAAAVNGEEGDLDFVSRIPTKAHDGPANMASTSEEEKEDEDARSVTLDITTDLEAPVNMSRTYFERICKWVGHNVDFGGGRMNLRGLNT